MHHDELEGFLRDYLNANYTQPDLVESHELRHGADDIEKITVMAMLIWIIRQSMTPETRQEFIQLTLSKLRQKLVQQLDAMARNKIIEDLLSPHREDVIITIDKNLKTAKDRLLEVLGL
jgi:hypothetical protein